MTVADHVDAIIMDMIFLGAFEFVLDCVLEADRAHAALVVAVAAGPIVFRVIGRREDHIALPEFFTQLVDEVARLVLEGLGLCGGRRASDCCDCSGCRHSSHSCQCCGTNIGRLGWRVRLDHGVDGSFVGECAGGKGVVIVPADPIRFVGKRTVNGEDLDPALFARCGRRLASVLLGRRPLRGDQRCEVAWLISGDVGPVAGQFDDRLPVAFTDAFMDAFVDRDHPVRQLARTPGTDQSRPPSRNGTLILLDQANVGEQIAPAKDRVGGGGMLRAKRVWPHGGIIRHLGQLDLGRARDARTGPAVELGGIEFEAGSFMRALHHPVEGNVGERRALKSAADVGMNAGKPDLLDVLPGRQLLALSQRPQRGPERTADLVDRKRMQGHVDRRVELDVVEPGELAEMV